MSQFKVRKDIIYLACKNGLDLIKEGRVNARQELFDIYKKRTVRNFWLKKELEFKTDDEINNYIEKYGDDSQGPWGYDYKSMYSKTEGYCNKLIFACEVDCEDYIMLNAEDASFINKWI